MNRLIAREASIASRNATANRTVRYLQTGSSSSSHIGDDQPLHTTSTSSAPSPNASASSSSSSSSGRTTHFGFKTIPEEEKETLGAFITDL